MALPTVRGQLMSFSKKSVQSLMNGKIPSKAMRRHHHHARNQETGHAMKTRRSSQRMLYIMVDAMVFTKVLRCCDR